LLRVGADPHQSKCVGGFDGITFYVRVRQEGVRRGVGNIGRLVPTPSEHETSQILDVENKPQEIARDQNMKGATQQRAESSFNDFAGGFPHSIETEQDLLGAILINNDALQRVIGFLQPEHFFEPIQIYDVIVSLIGGGKIATPVTLKAFLPDDLDIAGLKLGTCLARLAAGRRRSSTPSTIGASASTCRHVGRSFQRLIARTLIGRNEDGQNE
jgi:hypothetical protein